MNLTTFFHNFPIKKVVETVLRNFFQQQTTKVVKTQRKVVKTQNSRKLMNFLIGAHLLGFTLWTGVAAEGAGFVCDIVGTCVFVLEFPVDLLLFSYGFRQLQDKYRGTKTNSWSKWWALKQINSVRTSLVRPNLQAMSYKTVLFCFLGSTAES